MCFLGDWSLCAAASGSSCSNKNRLIFSHKLSVPESKHTHAYDSTFASFYSKTLHTFRTLSKTTSDERFLSCVSRRLLIYKHV